MPIDRVTKQTPAKPTPTTTRPVVPPRVRLWLAQGAVLSTTLLYLVSGPKIPKYLGE
jgi:hypothetical protein